MTLILALVLDAARLELKAEAEVTEAFVPLFAVVETADVPQDIYAVLSGVYVGPAPEPGRVRVIEAVEIRRVLRRNGCAGRVELVGDRVEVRRVEEDVAVGRRILLDALQGEAMRLALEATYETPERLRAHVEHSELAEMPEGARLVEMEAPGGAPFGRRAYAYRLEYADGTSTWHNALVTVQRRADVAYTTRRISANHRLQESDFETRAIWTDSVDEFLSADEIVGGRAREAVAADAALTRALVTPRPVVTARQTLHAVGRFFEADVTALEDGAAGEVIRVRSEETQREFLCRVIGPGRAEVLE